MISVSGSILSGAHSSLFWCEDEKKFIETKEKLPIGFAEALKQLKDFFDKSIETKDFSDKAVEQLLSEINGY